jgi:TPR repeat protein
MVVVVRRAAWLLLVTITVVAKAVAAPQAIDAPLANAAEQRDTAAVVRLLQGHVDVNIAQPDGATALHWAAHWDDVGLARELLTAGARAQVVNDYGVSPLTLAAVNGSAAMLGLLLDAGANPNTKLPSGETAIMTAVESGSLAAVERLVAAGADPNASQISKGQTALMWAAAKGQTEIARILIARGADVRALSKGGTTALMFAARAGSIETCQLLMTAGASVDARAVDGSTALLIATVRGRVDLAAWLLDHGAAADGDLKDAGYTPLHWAVSRFENPVAGSALDPPDEWKSLSGISDGGAQLSLIRALVNHGASLEARTLTPLPAPPLVPGAVPVGGGSTVGGTPFLLAAASGDATVMRLLVSLGARTQVRAQNGATPLIAAATGNRDYAVRITESARLEAVQLAADYGDDLEAEDNRGYRAMHAAAAAGYHEIVSFLLGKSADLNPRTRERSEGSIVLAGQTPLGMVEGTFLGTGALFERPETAAFLRRLGARSEGAVTLESFVAIASRGARADADVNGLQGLAQTGAAAAARPLRPGQDATAQFRQGLAYLRGAGVAQDDQRAASLFEQSCDAGVAAACTNLGYVFANGRGVAKDDARAATLYQRACDGGEITACTNLGFLLANGQGAAKDERRAVSLYQRACDGGNSLACVNLGLMTQYGRGTSQDQPRAVTLYARSCDGGNALGCTALGFMYANGRGVAKDEPRATALYQTGCDKGVARSCSNLAFMYENGEGVGTDYPRAIELYQKACNGGDTQGCWRLGIGLDCIGDCVLTRR